MIQETCAEIGELEAHWVAQREARNARRQQIRRIDDLIDEFERLNLADEPDVPYELVGRVVAVVGAHAHALAGRPPDDVIIAEWMDALYDVQDSLMFTIEDEAD